MKIKYDVPCPCTSGLKKGLKFEKQYQQIFYFVHSSAKEIEIECDNPKSFIRSCSKALTYIYPKFKYQTVDKKVRVIKTW